MCCTKSWDIFVKMFAFLLQISHPPTLSLVPLPIKLRDLDSEAGHPCAFHFVENFEFVEFKSKYCYYLENDFEFLNQSFTLWLKLHCNHFYNSMVKIWNRCIAGDYLLIQTIYKVLDMLPVWNLDEWWTHECGNTAFSGITLFQLLNWNASLHTGYEVEVWA